MPNAAQTKCVAKVANCVVAQTADGTLCETCADGYVKKAGACLPGDVRFCASHAATTATDPACLECLPGYYLKSARECLPGLVANCLSFASGNAWKCTQCRSGFQLTTSASGVSFCFPVDPGLLCAQFEPGKFLDNVLSCVQCARNATTGLPIRPWLPRPKHHKRSRTK